MNSYTESSLGKDGSNTTRITTLYDLMEEINAATDQPAKGSRQLQYPGACGEWSIQSGGREGFSDV